MPSRQSRVQNLLLSDDAFATTLLVLLIDEYGSEALAWSPETIKWELEDDFAIRELSKDIFDRLMAAIQVVTSDDFYKRLPTFIFLCNILSGSSPDAFDPADAKECAWGMTEAMLLSPPESEDKEPYASEIRHYLGAVLDNEGIREPPDLLRLAIRDTVSGTADYTGMSIEDPVMFGAEFGMQTDKSTEIKEMLQSNLRELFEQLESIELVNGDTKKLLERVQGNLTSA